MSKFRFIDKSMRILPRARCSYIRPMGAVLWNCCFVNAIYCIWMLQILWNFTKEEEKSNTSFHIWICDKTKMHSHIRLAAAVKCAYISFTPRAHLNTHTWIRYKIRVILKFNWFQWGIRKVCKRRLYVIWNNEQTKESQLHASPNKTNSFCYTFFFVRLFSTLASFYFVTKCI